ncbi:MAG: trigger factor [Patescibacteria group bacterium]
MKTTIKKLEKSEVEILGVLEVLEFQKYEDKALAHISERVELPGFRKGKVPASMVKESVNEMMILEEMAELAISDAYPKIIQDEKIDAIGRPQVTITKIAKGSDLEFKIVTAVLPEMKLPDYKKLASKILKDKPKVEVVVDEKEVEKTILELRKMRAHQAMPAHDHQDNDEAHPELSEEQLPAFDDAFAKTFGDFATADAFREKIRANMKIEKETVEKDKLRLSVVEELLKETSGDIPSILIDTEVDKILYRLQADITNAGLKFEDYLVQIGKKEEDLRGEWRADAEKRAKLQVVIHTISEKENLKPSEEEIEKEVNNIMTMYKDADPMRARAYIENMLENEKVFNFLETQ